MIKEFKENVKKLYNYFKNNSFKTTYKVLLEILGILLLLCLLKLPFSAIRDLIISMLTSLRITGKGKMDIIYTLFEIPYIILFIYIFIKMINKRYSDFGKKED